MGARTVMRMTARPGSQESNSICMNSVTAGSSAYMASATAVARPSGDLLVIGIPPPGLCAARPSPPPSASGGGERLRAAVRRSFAGELRRALFAERHHAFDVVVRLAQARLGIA